MGDILDLLRVVIDVANHEENLSEEEEMLR
jgi:hypothetical protein